MDNINSANTVTSAASLLKEAEELVETRLRYAGLRMVDKSAAISGSAIFVVAICLVLTGLLLTISFALAFLISAKMGSKPSGFFAVGLFYLLVMIFFLLFRRRLLRVPLTNVLINKMMK